jgi:hypothetical protein
MSSRRNLRHLLAFDLRLGLPEGMVSTMARFTSLLRRTMAVMMAGAVLLLLGLPVCSSEACPMAKMDRALCRAMGFDCCGASAGRLSHASPQLASPEPAALGLAFAPVAAPAATAGGHPSLLAPAAPAVIQGVGLHTLLAVFRI